MFSQCAKVGTPTGGPRDRTAPVYLGSKPVHEATRFDSRKVELYFNEHVEVKNQETQLTISPPMKQAPEFITAPKKLIMGIKDTLRKNTTYTISFGEGLVDLNEGNPLGSFEYVFSTGEQVDSLSYIGRVFNASTLEPEKIPDKGAYYFMLYKGQEDSLPMKEQPYYLSRVDDVGFFRMTHIAPGKYLPFVLKDLNNTLIFDDPNGESIAFSDSLLQLDQKYFKTDSFVFRKKDRDSLLLYHAEPFGIDQVFFTFDNPKSNQYLKSSTRTDSIHFSLIFNRTSPEIPKVRILDSLAPAKWFVMERSARSDSFVYWIYDQRIAKARQLSLEVTYPETDSLLRWVNTVDTLALTLPPPEKSKKPKDEVRKPRRNEEPVKAVKAPKVNPLPLTSNLNGSVDIDRLFYLETVLPVDSVDVSRLHLRQDTLKKEIPFTFRRDSLSSRRFWFDWKKDFDRKYSLTVDSGAFFSPFGVHNDTIQVFQASVKRAEDYGSIVLTLKGVGGDVVVQLLDASGEAVLRNYKVSSDTLLNIPYLLKGLYVLKAVHDVNRDGVWTSGDYLSGLQPERVEFCQMIPEVQESFDTQVEWTLKRSPADKEKETHALIQSVRSPVREELVKLKAAEEKKRRAAEEEE